MSDGNHAHDTNFGQGIGLTEDFDILADERGDLALFTGSEELAKDLSLIVAHRLRNMVGGAMTKQIRARIRTRTKSTLRQDPRVLSVVYVRIISDDGDDDRVSVEVEVLTHSDGYLTFTSEVNT